MDGRARFEQHIQEMVDTFRRKNAGYSPSGNDPWANFRFAELIGVRTFDGVLVRMSDKFIRVANLAQHPDREQVGEAITDSLTDLAVYAIIARCIYEEETEKSFGPFVDSETLSKAVMDAGQPCP